MGTCVGVYTDPTNTKMRIVPNMRARKPNTIQRLFLQNGARERLISAGGGHLERKA